MKVSPVVVMVRSLMLHRWFRKLAGKGLMFLLSLTSLYVLRIHTNALTSAVQKGCREWVDVFCCRTQAGMSCKAMLEGRSRNVLASLGSTLVDMSCTISACFNPRDLLTPGFTPRGPFDIHQNYTLYFHRQIPHSDPVLCLIGYFHSLLLGKGTSEQVNVTQGGDDSILNIGCVLETAVYIMR